MQRFMSSWTLNGAEVTSDKTSTNRKEYELCQRFSEIT